MLARIAVAAVPTLWLQAVAAPALAGLWDFSGLRTDGVSAVSVEIRARASPSSVVIARLDGEGIVSAEASTRLCKWERDLDVGAPPSGCIYAESGYEIRSVAVFEHRREWLRIALDNSASRFGWVRRDGAFHSLSELLGSDNLTYLTPQWNRRLYDAPAVKALSAGGRLARLSGRSGQGDFAQPYQAVRTAVVDGRLWLHVELLDEVCGAQEPRVIDRGWVPAQSVSGEQWAWFWSRGC